MTNNPKPRSCDIFCNVIDNYGDIGVSWRLARQLANEFGIRVRLWVDDLKSFARLCPEADAMLEVQVRRGVEVRLWNANAFTPLSQPLLTDGERGVADLVIEAFGCKMPEVYLAAMSARAQEPVWINLEYLSAEDWVEGCHKLPSPKPPLTRYFFFPGFTKKTGGLLLERDLLARRDAFLSDPLQQQAFWRSVGMDTPSPDALKISLFSYENPALEGLFDTWAQGEKTVLCLVPEGRILPQVLQYFDEYNSPRSQAGEGGGEREYVRGNLTVRVLPFVEQERYDELLWACDINFVRGEDSCVRAQWAGKPFIWQIYPQHDEVHRDKLLAFLHRYCAGLTPLAAGAVEALWQRWNGETSGDGEWADFALCLDKLNPHARVWAEKISQNNLALNLLDFFQEIGTMRAFEVDEQ